MSDEEKKFKLDQLPDEGSVPPLPKKLPLKKFRKKGRDPRVIALDSKDDPEKVEWMAKRWSFDKPEIHYGWLIYALLLLALQMSGLEKELSRYDLRWLSELFGEFSFLFVVLIQKPLVLLLFTPLFFNYRSPSDFVFEVTFDGLHTVKKFTPTGSKESPVRAFVKWNQIEKVRKREAGAKEILSLYAADDEHIADIIWYIVPEKKKALALVLAKLLPAEHPLRAFLEKEKDLL